MEYVLNVHLDSILVHLENASLFHPHVVILILQLKNVKLVIQAMNLGQTKNVLNPLLKQEMQDALNFKVTSV